jgi:dihydroorotate dehydrogenase
MSDLFSAIGRKGLFLLDPEVAHGLSIKALKSGFIPTCHVPRDSRLQQEIAGIIFPNPIGMAAGFDKNAEVPAELLKLGFGFTEIGTVTPKAQAGNSKPRLFRLVDDSGVINRLGFNNNGHDAAFSRLKQANVKGIIGVNIGANKDSTDRIADYVEGIATFYDVATYFTANISSPNTPGLRDLQARDSLSMLLAAILAKRDSLAEKTARYVPVFLKIAPDLTEEGLDDVAEEVLLHKLDGLIVSNTTLSRDGLKSKVHTGEMGGLSGTPLFDLSTTVLAKMRKRVGKDLPIIGVGGISSAQTAMEKIRAGADLVQFYSNMVYQGPLMPSRIVKGLSTILDKERVGSISEMRDSSLDHWAARSL